MSKPTFNPVNRFPGISTRPVPSNAIPQSTNASHIRTSLTSPIARGPVVPNTTLKSPVTSVNPGPVQSQAPNSTPSIVTQSTSSRHLDRSMTLPIDFPLPEGDIFRRILDVEAKMDFYLHKAQLRLQRALSDPIRQTFTSSRILRFTVSNTHEGQPIIDGQEVTYQGKEPSWSIRLSGRLLDAQGNMATGTGTKKMSSFFKSIVVQLDRNEFPNQWNIVWNRSRSADDVDTFTFTHKSRRESTVNIYLYPANHQSGPETFSPSPALREALDLTSPHYSRQDLLIAIWRYIRQHELQDPMRKSSVRCNEALKGIFDLDGFEYDDLPDLLQGQMLTAEPIHIPYQIRFCKDNRDADVAIDIPVELDLQPFPNLNLNSHQSKINEMNRYVSEHIDRIGSKKRKRDFYLDFATDPLFFMYEWLQSQYRDQSVMSRPSAGPSKPSSSQNGSSSTNAKVPASNEMGQEKFTVSAFHQPLATAAVHSLTSQTPSRIPQDVPFVNTQDYEDEM
jgi:SWI/SNF-related matrix-associated actin-dependent regulator of chromatin subfamily D